MRVSAQQLTAETNLRAASALLAMLSAWLVLRILILLVDGIEVGFEPIEYSPSPTDSALPGQIDWRMFGEPVAVDYGFDRPLPPTPLSLRLRGVVTGERGYAIIVDGNGDEGVYRAGDEVPGGAEVLAIEARRVVLSRNGEREALELPGAGAGQQSPISRASAADEPAASGVRGIGIGSLGSMASQFRLDPDELARRITILPVAGGGFRVRAGRDAQIFSALGFHVNDVVIAINGQPVNNQRDVRALFQEASLDRPLAITVRRGDRQVVLTPDLSAIFGANP